MTRIKKNTLVVLNIILKNDKGDIIVDKEELTYLHGGYNQIFPKLEQKLENKAIGDVFELILTPAEAFGEIDDSLIVKELLENLPKEISIGLELDGENGMIYIVENIEQEYAILNANHELAGITLLASGEILEVKHLSDKVVKELLKEEKH
ncbi:FKBP-type peptidyl-prolyl cis-trans isomerase [Aliarcobacter vitoriensis]|uniref:peptidylprolyl isomerase n=1 Tax=Aliarcobacter vitoriensis TaxID=2011099 RepID=A0A366MQD8_9BACT|nr:peptidylprolyl isomerase [Aliarcobacter vitoriensis]RBQ28486.1 peptidylprolyl isomerase [Aliarcobacter vitoriensis]